MSDAADASVGVPCPGGPEKSAQVQVIKLQMRKHEDGSYDAQVGPGARGTLRAPREAVPCRACGLSRAATAGWGGPARRAGGIWRRSRAPRAPREMLPVYLAQQSSSSDPAGTESSKQPSPPGTSHRQEATGASPQGTEDSNALALSRLCCSWSQAGPGPTERCDHSWSHPPTATCSQCWACSWHRHV